MNPARTPWVDKLEWSSEEEQLREEVANPDEADAGWTKKDWSGTPYWEHESGHWQLWDPQGAVSGAHTEPTKCSQSVDELVFVGIWAPDLYRHMKGQLCDEGGHAPEPLDKAALREACKTTMLRPKVAGASVSLAITKRIVAWPSFQWWMERVVKEKLLAQSFRGAVWKDICWRDVVQTFGASRGN